MFSASEVISVQTHWNKKINILNISSLLIALNGSRISVVSYVCCPLNPHWGNRLVFSVDFLRTGENGGNGQFMFITNMFDSSDIWEAILRPHFVFIQHWLEQSWMVFWWFKWLEWLETAKPAYTCRAQAPVLVSRYFYKVCMSQDVCYEFSPQIRFCNSYCLLSHLWKINWCPSAFFFLLCNYLNQMLCKTIQWLLSHLTHNPTCEHHGGGRGEVTSVCLETWEGCSKPTVFHTQWCSIVLKLPTAASGRLCSPLKHLFPHIT